MAHTRACLRCWFLFLEAAIAITDWPRVSAQAAHHSCWEPRTDLLRHGDRSFYRRRTKSLIRRCLRMAAGSQARLIMAPRMPPTIAPAGAAPEPPPRSDAIMAPTMTPNRIPPMRDMSPPKRTLHPMCFSSTRTAPARASKERKRTCPSHNQLR